MKFYKLPDGVIINLSKVETIHPKGKTEKGYTILFHFTNKELVFFCEKEEEYNKTIESLSDFSINIL